MRMRTNFTLCVCVCVCLLYNLRNCALQPGASENEKKLHLWKEAVLEISVS